MDNLILMPVPLNDLLEGMKKHFAAILEEKLASNNHNWREKNPLFERPVSEKELCEYFRISVPTAIRYRKQGKIPYLSIGSAIRYNLADVEQALQSKKPK